MLSEQNDGSQECPTPSPTAEVAFAKPLAEPRQYHPGDGGCRSLTYPLGSQEETIAILRTLVEACAYGREFYWGT